MPSRLCPECQEVIPASGFQAHHRRHVEARKERKGGSRAWRRLRGLVIARDGGGCVVCGATSELEVHHIDGDWRNDALGNLETRCFSHNPRGRPSRGV